MYQRLQTTLVGILVTTLISGCGIAVPETPITTMIPTTTQHPLATTTPTETVLPQPTVPATILPTSTPVLTDTPTATSRPYELISNQYYVVEGDPVRKLSLYLPSEESRRPFTLLIAAGQYFPDLIDYFVELGYPVISFNTRNDSYLTEIQDGFCALAWTRANARAFGFDAAQLVPIGGSMWGGNAALLGLVDDPAPFLEECPNTLPETGRVRAIITLAGVFDYSEEGDFFAGFIHNISDFMGGTPAEVPDNWAAASAINWVQGDEPPFLLIHGTSDINVAPSQSEKFADVLEIAGTEVSLVLLPGVNHNTSVTDPQVFTEMQSFLERLEQTATQDKDSDSLIAFTSERNGNSDIYVMNADGSNQRRLTDDPAYDAWSSWSPDGSRIAFVSTRSGNADIYIMDVDGTNPRQLTQHSADDIWPAWSPDGTRIAFPSRRDGNFEIYVINVDGTGLQRLTNTTAAEDFPTWSPDSMQLLFSRIEGNDGTYLMHADGSQERQLLDFPILEPAWSPDGSRIAFGSDHEGFRGIYVMDADGRDLQRLSTNRSGENCPDWSPDGTKITFVSWRDGIGEIYVMDVDGINLLQLTQDWFADEFPDWQPIPRPPIQ
jgi:Tol biopolymer transport system component